jgi:hypothetical protein
MHNKSISPSYAEDQVSGQSAGAAGRRRTPPPRLIYTTTVHQKMVSSDLHEPRFPSRPSLNTWQVTWSACIMPYGRFEPCNNPKPSPQPQAVILFSVTWGDGDTYSGPGDWATTVQVTHVCCLVCDVWCVTRSFSGSATFLTGPSWLTPPPLPMLI